MIVHSNVKKGVNRKLTDSACDNKIAVNMEKG